MMGHLWRPICVTERRVKAHQGAFRLLPLHEVRRAQHREYTGVEMPCRFVCPGANGVVGAADFPDKRISEILGINWIDVCDFPHLARCRACSFFSSNSA